MSSEAIRVEDPLVTAISTDHNLRYWVELLESRDYHGGPDETEKIRREAWEVTAAAHGADPEDLHLRLAVVMRWAKDREEREAYAASEA